MSLIRVFALALLFDHAFGFLYKDLAVSSKRFKSIASDSYGILLSKRVVTFGYPQMGRGVGIRQKVWSVRIGPTFCRR